jgi:hypothetical protein
MADSNRGLNSLSVDAGGHSSVPADAVWGLDLACRVFVAGLGALLNPLAIELE